MDETNDLTETFNKALQANLGSILKISRAYTNHFHDTEDLVHDIIFQIWKSFKTFNSDAKISTWIYRIALNTALSYHQKRQKNHVIYTDDILKNDYNQIVTLDENDLEKHRALYHAIEKLDSINRAIILLYLDGLQHKEISEIIGMSTSNIGTRIGRIKEQLKENLNVNNNL
jgi:RNA polymerase sigma-70 factor, ECF subfamily